MRLFRAALAIALLGTAVAAASASAQERRDPDSVRIVTSDIPNFWRAYDLAAGKDSAERVRILEEVYLRPGSHGLYEWARVRLSDRRDVDRWLIDEGWTSETIDSARRRRPGSPLRDSLDRAARPHILHSGAEQLVVALGRAPRYYASARPRSLAVDTSSVVTSTVRRGLRRLAELYPGARFPDIYFLIGTMSTGGTVTDAGMLIGTEQYSSAADTPMDELPPWFAEIIRANSFERLGALVVHEAVHTLQPDRAGPATLLSQSLGEGVADFVSELAVGPWLAETPRHRYGRLHEREVWLDFRDEMATDSTLRTWMYNGNVPFPKNHGAVDIGYWVGYAIAKAYYERADDEQAAIRELIELPDPGRLLRESRYDGVTAAPRAR